MGYFKGLGVFLLFYMFEGILVIFFKGFRGILAIYRFREYFGHFLGFGGILVIFRFQNYFGQFLGFGVILVIFLGFGGYFPYFF